MGTILVLLSLLGFIVSLILLIIAIIKKKKKRLFVLGLVVAVIMFFAGGVMLVSDEDINQVESAKDNIQIKTFGTYMVQDTWSENKALSTDNKYFYLKDGASINSPTSNISIETGKNRYSENDHIAFREAILQQLLMQASYMTSAPIIHGDGVNTKQGYTMYIFTIEEESITTKQYYIVGDYKYILVIETDFHDENIPDVSETARAIVDSFEWIK